jgi:DNA-binding NarL/FixJ family response regulator
MLLDGCSRKEIAAKMSLSLHIVNDSIKAIYRHFGTSSATELAARFMKGA